MKALIRAVEQFEKIQLPWWLWPSFLVVLAVVSVGAAAFFQPLGDAWVAWPGGGQLGDTCGMVLATGLPCPQCGMTRSWVHGIRGDLVASFFFNPAGLGLLLWIIVGGVLGAGRLITRDAQRFQVSNSVMFIWLIVWLVPLYAGSYLVRIAGYNILP